jgi:hypothetical protein
LTPFVVFAVSTCRGLVFQAKEEAARRELEERRREEASRADMERERERAAEEYARRLKEQEELETKRKEEKERKERELAEKKAKEEEEARKKREEEEAEAERKRKEEVFKPVRVLCPRLSWIRLVFCLPTSRRAHLSLSFVSFSLSPVRCCRSRRSSKTGRNRPPPARSNASSRSCRT